MVFYGIHGPTESAHQKIELLQCGFIHPVEESGQSGLRCKCLFVKDSRQYRITNKFVRTVIFKIGTEDLVDNLPKVLIILVKSECCVIGFKNRLQKFHKAKFTGEFFNKKQACIGGQITSGKNLF